MAAISVFMCVVTKQTRWRKFLMAAAVEKMITFVELFFFS